MSRVTTPDNFFDTSPSFNYTPRSREDVARSQGYTIQGDRAVRRNAGGTPIFIQLSDPRFNDPDMPGMTDQLGDALFSDMRNQQTLADQAFKRGEKTIGEFDNVLAGADKSILGARDSAIEAVRRAEGAATADFATYDKQAEASLLDMDKRLATASAYTRSAVASSGRAVEDYERDSRSNVAAMTSGLSERINQSLTEINAGLNPDGTMMTPAQRAQAKAQVTGAGMRQIAEVTGQLWQDASANIASLRNTLASVQSDAAKTELSAASQRGAISSDLAKTRLGASVDLAGIRSNLASLEANIHQSSALALLQTKLQGYQTKFALQEANRAGSVSTFAGLSALYALRTAPGANRVPGINTPTQPTFG